MWLYQPKNSPIAALSELIGFDRVCVTTDSQLPYREELEDEVDIRESELLEYARKNGYKSGKWLLYLSEPEADRVWPLIAKGCWDDRFPYASCTIDEHPKFRIIRVYTHDFDNEANVMTVRSFLMDIGITKTLTYKPSIYTIFGLYCDKFNTVMYRR